MPSAVYWGEQKALLYNDGYKAFAGEKRKITQQKQTQALVQNEKLAAVGDGPQGSCSPWRLPVREAGHADKLPGGSQRDCV